MSIPEASRLVLQAGAIGSSGETLILDMGEPVKILDLAKKLIRHHKSDVEIVITGLRPNEKIHEELGHEGEVLETKNHKRIWHSQAVVVDVSDDLATLLAPGPRELAARLMDLAKATATSDNVKVHS